MGKIIAITNQKGGVGKTTSAVNLSSSLALSNKKVLLVDIDPQGNACSGVGIDKEKVDHSIYEVLLREIAIEKVIRHTYIPGLDVVPVNINLTGATIELVNQDAREYRLKEALDGIKQLYDYMIIDCPPSLDILTLNGLTAADSAIIPLQCEYFALEGLAQLLRTVHLVQKELNTKLTIEGVLLTMFDSRTNLAHQVMQEAKSYFKDKVYKAIIPRNIKLSEAPSFGQSIFDYDASSVGAKSYKALAEEVMSHV